MDNGKRVVGNIFYVFKEVDFKDVWSHLINFGFDHQNANSKSLGRQDCTTPTAQHTWNDST